jgi:sugar lactone lactonase YvrE
MKRNRIRLGVSRVAGTLLAISVLSGACAAAETLGEIERLDPAFDRLVAPEAQIEVLAKGFTWTEGPVWVPQQAGGYLLFSDIPRNSVFQWQEGQGVRLFLHPSGYTGREFYGLEPGSNGLLLDPQGRLVSCEHGDRRVSVLTEGGGKRTLVDSYQGKRLNSPNDAVYMSNGDLYFTDPPYGLPDRWDDPRRELDFCGVYRLGKDGQLTLLTTEMARPNGIALSPDEKTLYVAQSDPEAAIWKAFPGAGGRHAGHQPSVVRRDRVGGQATGSARRDGGGQAGSSLGHRARRGAGLHARGPIAGTAEHAAADGQLCVRRRRQDAVHHGRFVPVPHPDPGDRRRILNQPLARGFRTCYESRCTGRSLAAW